MLANLVAGAGVGWVCNLCFGPDWNMVLAMFAGMALGMVLSLLPSVGFGALFGAMEVMVPVMTTGMVAGMVVAMEASHGHLGSSAALGHGALCGLVVLVATYAANAALRRRSPRWTP